jgi:hypothetical protein
MTTDTAFESQGALAILIPMILQWLKGAPWFPWVTKETSKLNALAAGVGAVVATAGIHFVWDPGNHSITINGLTIAAVLTAIIAVAKQYLFQHAAYKLMYPESTVSVSYTQADKPAAPPSSTPSTPGAIPPQQPTKPSQLR